MPDAPEEIPADDGKRVWLRRDTVVQEMAEEMGADVEDVDRLTDELVEEGLMETKMFGRAEYLLPAHRRKLMAYYAKQKSKLAVGNLRDRARSIFSEASDDGE